MRSIILILVSNYSWAIRYTFVDCAQFKCRLYLDISIGIRMKHLEKEIFLSLDVFDFEVYDIF
jgi:hypothetical protein